MTDNGSGYRSSLFNDWLEAAGIERKHARPYSPWQNGKVERMNRTLAQERQYARAYASEGGVPIVLSTGLVPRLIGRRESSAQPSSPRGFGIRLFPAAR